MSRARRVLRRLLNRTLLTTARSLREFVDDRGHRDAAQIAFFAILSAVPLGLLLVGAFGLVFEDDELRERVVSVTFDNVPLSTDSERERLENTVVDALEGAGNLGPFPLLLLFFAASGVMGALRHAINQAWDIHERPPLLRRKALDFALVLGGVVLLVFVMSVTVTRRAADALDESEGASVGSTLLDALGDVLPFAFTALAALFLYRVLPMWRPRVRDIWPGAIVAAGLISLVRGGLDIYFKEFADFGALYGSLGALMALLLFVYAGSMVLVFGAEFASEYARLPDDEEVDRIVGERMGRLRRRLHVARPSSRRSKLGR